MSGDCAPGRLVPLPLDREERWIVHSVLLDYVELAGAAGAEAPDLACELAVLEAIEDGDSAFTAGELDRVRSELAAYARALDSPERDRATAEALVERLTSGWPASRREQPAAGCREWPLPRGVAVGAVPRSTHRQQAGYGTRASGPQAGARSSGTRHSSPPNGLPTASPASS